MSCGCWVFRKQNKATATVSCSLCNSNVKASKLVASWLGRAANLLDYSDLVTLCQTYFLIFMSSILFDHNTPHTTHHMMSQCLCLATVCDSQSHYSLIWQWRSHPLHQIWGVDYFTWGLKHSGMKSREAEGVDHLSVCHCQHPLVSHTSHLPGISDNNNTQMLTQCMILIASTLSQAQDN